VSGPGDPARWLDVGGDVDPDLLAALEATQTDFASDAQLAAVEAKLLTELGGPGGGGGGDGGAIGPESIAPGAATTSYAVPAGLAVAALVAAGVVALLWPGEPAEPAPPPAAAAPVTPEEVSLDDDVAPPEPTPAAQEPAPPRAPAATAERPRLDEGQLLERARRLVRRRPAAATRALRAHRARFADGALAEEREALWVEALHHQGRDDAARAALERFQRRYPSSVHRVRLSALFD